MDWIRHSAFSAKLEWRKSSRCGPQGTCVELAKDGDTVVVRDSKEPSGPMIRITAGRLAAFAAQLRRHSES
jgi:hypothetical protein